MEKWYIVATTRAAVQFEGTREEAREHLNELTARIELLFRENGITFKRQEHMIVADNELSELKDARDYNSL